MTGNPQDPTQVTEPTEPTANPAPTEPNGDVEPAQPAEPNGNAANPDPTDWKAWSRHWEDMSKANKKDADEARTKLEAATKRAEEAEAKIAKLEANAAREKTVNAVAAETGVSAAVLNLMRGDTEEEIRANAAVMQSNIPIFPTVKEAGNAAAPTVTKESILGIENEAQRLKAIQENMSLFE